MSRIRNVTNILRRPRADGFYVAPYTPFNEKHDLNLNVISKYVNHLVKNNVDGAYVNGTNGEFPNLSVDERKALQSKWLQEGAGKLELIVHIGSINVRDSIELAKHAAANGAKAIAAIMPFYYHNNNVGNAVETLAAIGAAVPETPLVYYHFPTLTKTSYSAIDVLRAARDRVPNLIGVKFTDTDVTQMLQLTELRHPDGQPYLFLPGFEHGFNAMLTTGIRGTISGMMNWMPGEFLVLRSAFEAGNHTLARERQLRILNMKKLVARFDQGGDFGAMKDAMRVVGRRVFGFDVGPARLPLRTLSESELGRMEKALEEAGFFEWHSVS